jgi:hypothetical protein
MGMTQDEGSKGEDIINELIAILIPNPTSFPPLYKQGLSSHSLEGTHRAIHPTGDVFSGLCEELL